MGINVARPLHPGIFEVQRQLRAFIYFFKYLLRHYNFEFNRVGTRKQKVVSQKYLVYGQIVIYLVRQ